MEEKIHVIECWYKDEKGNVHKDITTYTEDEWKQFVADDDEEIPGPSKSSMGLMLKKVE